MSDWGPVNARARGLASRLLAPAALDALGCQPALAEVRRLAAARGLAIAAGADAAAVERAHAAAGAAELRELDRWLDAGQRAALAPLFADEDRRSLRRILRGLAAGEPPARRAAATLPTPTLPARLLAELALQPTPLAVATLLTAAGSPFGAALAAASWPGDPRLLRLELALDAAFAAAAAAGRERDAPLRRLYTRWIDGTNAAAAVLLAGADTELAAASCFSAGGRALPLAAFLAAATAPDAGAAARQLAPAFRGEVGAALRRGDTARGRLDDALLADALAEQRSLARRLPLSAAPTAAYLLALRAEAVALRRAAWRAALAGEAEAA